MKSRVFSFLKFLIGWPLSLISLFYIFQLIAPHTTTILTNLTNLNGVLLLWGIVCFISFYFIRSYIWYRLMKQHEKTITFKNACFAWATSELKRYIPGNVWSFLGRTVIFSEMGVHKKTIGKSLVIEAILLVLGSAIISLLAIPFIISYTVFPLPPYTLPVSISILLGIVLYYLIKHPHQLFLLFLSTISMLLFGIGHYFVITSFVSLTPQLIWLLSGFAVLSFLVGYLSILTPAGFGVREGFLVLGLGKLISFSNAAFVALFARIILIISELLFIAIALFWHKTTNTIVTKGEQWLVRHKQLAILIIFFLLYCVYFSITTFLRYDHFYTGKFDLGNMSQTVWNTTQGNFFEMTNPNGTEIVSRLAFHADFILILLAPFYALWSNPKVLLLIQTIVLAGGCFFVYLIAKEVLKNKNLALLFGFLYLINPSIQRTNMYDFHAVTLATTFLLATYYFLMKKRYGYFLLFAVLSGLCKEQVWLIVALFGLLVAIQGKRLLGICLFVLSTGLAFFLVSYAIPHALGSQHFALSYYSEFGDGPVAIIKSILFSPDKTIQTILQPDRIGYLRQLFSPLGYLSLLGPLILIFAGPDLLLNLLSNNAQLHQIYYQYPATISPFLFIAAIYGVLFVFSFLTKRTVAEKSFATKLRMTTILIIYLLITSCFAAYIFGPLPGAKEPNIDMLIKPLGERTTIDTYLSTIGFSAKVAASNNLASHLSQRRSIYVTPLGIEKADYVMFLLTDSQPTVSLAQDKALVEKLKTNPKFKLLVEKGQFVVFKKVIY